MALKLRLASRLDIQAAEPKIIRQGLLERLEPLVGAAAADQLLNGQVPTVQFTCQADVDKVQALLPDVQAYLRRFVARP